MKFVVDVKKLRHETWLRKSQQFQKYREQEDLGAELVTKKL